ncbi:MAG TPA: LemA family protein [Rhodospirillaceae bacterium]|nr:LemA family protein [Rhodospirillaceae bacterium]
MAASDARTQTAESASFDSLQRVKQSDELLAQLYVVEGQPSKLGRGTLNAMLVVSVLSLIAFVATVLMRYNIFVAMYEDSLSKRANYEVAIQRRDNLFGNLVKLTLNHAALEHSVFAHAADKRAEGIDAGTGNQITGLMDQLLKQSGPGHPVAIDGGFGAALGRLMAVVEQYPNIQSVDTYKHMMTSLVDMEDRIAERREGYNNSAALYNAEITKWPWDYLAVITGFKRFDYFHEKPEGDTPVITPELFQQLLPLAHVSGESRK